VQIGNEIVLRHCVGLRLTASDDPWPAMVPASPGPHARHVGECTRMPSTLPSADAAITCDACQACCCQLPVLLLPGDDPPDHFIDIDERGSPIMGKDDDGWCVALDRDTMRCTIYARRPWVCRAFEMAGSDCHDVRADWRRIALTLC
jgi:uncharacterized protein